MAALVVAAIAASLLVWAADQAAGRPAKLEHTGALARVPEASVEFVLVRRAGEPPILRRMRFRRVPVSCDDGRSGSISARLPGFRAEAGGFEREGEVRGSGIEDGTLRVSGEVFRAGRRAAGKVRFRFRSRQGADCDSGGDRWETKAR